VTTVTRACVTVMCDPIGALIPRLPSPLRP
jgi:hypothetical protein